MFEILFTSQAKLQYENLQSNRAYEKRYNAVSKALKLLAVNPRHPSLQTHEYQALRGPFGEKVFEAYAEHHTPGAYRVFWCYGPELRQITILSIAPHP